MHELDPLRYGRMVRSPFLFYRGAALNMAADIAPLPVTGLRVQACGDCHLSNFGASTRCTATARAASGSSRNRRRRSRWCSSRRGDRAGDVLIADSTIFSTLFGVDESLERFWKNLAAA
jgi:hypothetical protein